MWYVCVPVDRDRWFLPLCLFVLKQREKPYLSHVFLCSPQAFFALCSIHSFIYLLSLFYYSKETKEKGILPYVIFFLLSRLSHATFSPLWSRRTFFITEREMFVSFVFHVSLNFPHPLVRWWLRLTRSTVWTSWMEWLEKQEVRVRGQQIKTEKRWVVVVDMISFLCCFSPIRLLVVVAPSIELFFCPRNERLCILFVVQFVCSTPFNPMLVVAKRKRRLRHHSGTVTNRSIAFLHHRVCLCRVWIILMCLYTCFVSLPLLFFVLLYPVS